MNDTVAITSVGGSTIIHRLWGMQEVANYCGVSYWTIQRMVKRGEIPHTLFGNRPKFDPVVIKHWIEKRSIKGKT